MLPLQYDNNKFIICTSRLQHDDGKSEAGVAAAAAAAVWIIQAAD